MYIRDACTCTSLFLWYVHANFIRPPPLLWFVRRCAFVTDLRQREELLDVDGLVAVALVNLDDKQRRHVDVIGDVLALQVKRHFRPVSVC